MMISIDCFAFPIASRSGSIPSAGWMITLVIGEAPQRDGRELNRNQAKSCGGEAVYQLLLIFKSEILARIANDEEKVFAFDHSVSDTLRFDAAAKRNLFAKIVV